MEHTVANVTIGFLGINALVLIAGTILLFPISGIVATLMIILAFVSILVFIAGTKSEYGRRKPEEEE